MPKNAFIEMPPHQPSVPTHRDQYGPSGPALFECLVSELHSAAVMAAVITSGVEVLGNLQPASAGNLAAYAATDLDLFGSLLTVAVAESDSAQTFDAMRDFLGAYKDAQGTFAQYVSEAKTLGEARASVVHRQNLTSAWRQVCQDTMASLQEFEVFLGDGLPDIYKLNHKVLTGLLKRAAHGTRPCIDAINGSLVIPQLPQQRRWPRLSVLQTCRLTIAGETREAFVRDVCVGGIGLDRVPPLECGTVLKVDIESGRTLIGTVVWSRNGSAGMKFVKPLLPADPLIRS